MAVESSNTLASTPGIEQTLASPTTDAKRVLIVDVSALSGTESATLQVKGPVLFGGPVVVFRSATFYAGEPEPYTESDPCTMAFGGTFTLEQVGGSSRNFPWRVDTL